MSKNITIQLKRGVKEKLPSARLIEGEPAYLTDAKELYVGDSDGNAVPIVPDVGTPGTYRSVTTDEKGRVKAGTNPTTLAGYGITDAAPLSHAGATGTAHGTATAGGNAGFMSGSDKTKLDGIAAGAQVNTVTSVAGKTGAVTLGKGDVGLGNVDNTSDANKPVSTAQQTALNLKEDKAAKGVAGGYASLDSGGKIPLSQLSDAILGQLIYGGVFSGASATLSANAKTKLGTTSAAITLTNDTTAVTGYKANEGIFYIASASGAFASVSFETGDWLISTGAGWKKIDNTDAVTGVKGNAESSYRIGNINLTKADIGLGNVTDTAQAPATHVGAGGSAQHPLGNGTTAGFSTYDYTAAEKTKLSAAAAGATSNAKTTVAPVMNGAAAIGSDTGYAVGDHVHPTDTTRAPANAALTAETGTGTDTATPALTSATVASVLQTLWAKIRQVANAKVTANAAITG
ncbi:MAG: hypothetical protein FWF52_04215, partial [Candidatus Azobacteroides sp.]|nr:hypothetical protein [Candidatus Azobacteroides sp.]